MSPNPGVSQQQQRMSWKVVPTTAAHVVRDTDEDRQERADKGWSAADTWSFDTYLAGVIAGGVKALREREHGWPGNLDEGSDDANLAAWQAILDKIANGFELYSHEAFKPGAEMPEFEEAFDLLREWWGHLWD